MSESFSELLSQTPRFIFYCRNCKNTFHVEFKYFASAKEIKCPNCQTLLNSEAKTELENAINHLEKAIILMSNQILENDVDIFNEGPSAFSMNALWGKFNKLPDKETFNHF